MKPVNYLINAVLALIYSGVYMLCYIYFLSYHFSYMNYALYQRPAPFLALSVVICMLPVLCYRGYKAISSVLAVFTFVLLYVPVILTFALGSSLDMPEILGVQLTFMICMCFLFATDALVVTNPFDMHSKWDLNTWVFCLTLAATLYTLFVYRSNLRIVSFAEVYTQRAQNAQLGAGLVSRYVSAWLYTVLIPICLAYGLVVRRQAYFLLGSGACVTLYMATAAKAAIVLPIVYVGVYVLFNRDRLRQVYPLFVVTLSVLMSGMMLVRDTGSIQFQISSLLIMRTVATGGVLTRAYYDFFLTHPHTSYTHINVVNMVTGAYPYGDLAVSRVVGQYFFSQDMNANANFWATDGIAALGLIGVPVASILCAMLFMAMNSVTRGYNRLFVVLCFLPFLVSLFNTSVISSVWSGGAFFLMLFFLFNQRGAGLLAQQDQAVPSTSSRERVS